MTNKFWEDFISNSRPPSNGALRLPSHRFSPAEIEEICSKFEGKTDGDLNNEIAALIEQCEECLERFKFYPVQPELVEHLNRRIREIKICLETRWIERMDRGQQQSKNSPCAQCHGENGVVIMFAICRGDYEVTRLEHSYSRRAQSTVRTLRWRQVALIDTENLNEALEESIAALRDWEEQKYGIRRFRWKVEGIGASAGVEKEIDVHSSSCT